MSIKAAMLNWKILVATLLILFVTFGIIASDKSANEDSEVLPGVVAVLLLLNLVWLLVLGVYRAISRTTSTVNVVVNKVLSKRELRRKLLDALSDGIVTTAEEEEIKKIAHSLGLDDQSYSEIRRELLYEDTAPILKRIRETRRYSPEDEKKLTGMSAAHRISDAFRHELFERYRLLWEIETSGTFSPKPIMADIRLAKGEQCYFSAPAIWKQEKRVRERTGYVGGSVGLRIARGVTLRVGRAIPTYNEYDDIITISGGNIYVTNKKIAFVGDKKSTNITFGRLANYKLYRDAVQISKTSGSPDIFSLDEDDVLILDALLQVL